MKNVANGKIFVNFLICDDDLNKLKPQKIIMKL